jgi:GT2 family glycosyltransferase
MNKCFIFIADLFLENVIGGGELNNEELVKLLQEKKHTVRKIHSRHVDKRYLKKNKDSFFIIGNFVELSFECKEWLIQNANYIIYEHDHKYIASRNPAVYRNFKAPSTQLRNYLFYKHAQKVLCQTNFHRDILCKNLNLNNILSVGGNLWSLDILEKLRAIGSQKKTEKCSIMKSNIPHKNTSKAVSYCEAHGHEYELVSDNNYIAFLEKLGRNKTLVFFPGTPETLSRIVCEARMMGMSVKTNGLVGAAQEDWFTTKGDKLIDYMISKREEICEILIKESTEAKKTVAEKKVSIISTFHSGEEYLEGFLENITNLDMFDECELILIDSVSPGRERDIINPYLEKYDNIVYCRFEERFGPTAGHNLALMKVSTPYVALACIDDRKREDAIRVMYDSLSHNKDVDLVYGDCLVTSIKNETCEHTKASTLVEHSLGEFSRENMIKCLPGPMPMWRMKIHEEVGFFDEENHDFADDWEMWLRAVNNGSRFKKINKIIGLYLEGGRSQQENNLRQKKEEAKLFFKYSHIFGYNNNKKYGAYFRQFLGE